MTVRAQLREDINRGATEVPVMPIAALDSFDTSGTAYVGDDKFSYTSISGGSFQGCTGLDYSHEEGEFIVQSYGISYYGSLPPAYRVEANDPHRIIQSISEIVDETQIDYFIDKTIDVYQNIEPNLACEDYLEYICTSLGLEFGVDMDVELKRNLARNAVAVLKYRGSLNAFRFIVYHVLGYDVDVEIDKSKVFARMNNINHRSYRPPTEFGTDRRTVGLWRFVEGAGTTVANEIAGGGDFELHNAAMWDTNSMFRKDRSIKLDNVNTWAICRTPVGTLGNMRSKENFGIEFFISPTASLNFPQTILSKNNLISITRPDATSLTVTMTDGINIYTETFSDCITVGRFNYVSVLYMKPTLTLCVDGELYGYNVTFDLNTSLYDSGDEWVIGDTGGVPVNFEGYVDLLRISSGKMYPSESFSYFDHIRRLRTIGEDLDYNSYMLNYYRGNFVHVTINNSDGDMDKENVLKYLIEEWLTIGNYFVEQTGNLPLEMELGFI